MSHELRTPLNAILGARGRNTPPKDFAQDELGQIMRQVEGVRDAIVDSYGQYNRAVNKLRKLVGEVSSTATSVGDSSRQMASTSDETGPGKGVFAEGASFTAAPDHPLRATRQ